MVKEKLIIDIYLCRMSRLLILPNYFLCQGCLSKHERRSASLQTSMGTFLYVRINLPLASLMEASSAASFFKYIDLTRIKLFRTIY